jgi:hypothetical protein
MTDLVGRTLDRLAASLPGQVSSPSDAGYAAATAIWSKLVGLVPRALGHCRLSNDAALAVRAPICPFSQYLPDPAGIPDALPKNRAGKLHRRALRESLAGVEASQGSGPGIRRG